MSTEKQMTGYPSIDKPWLKYYPDFLINQERIITTLNSRLRTAWKSDETIINYYDTHITAKEFFERTDSIAKSLCALGIKEGDSIAVSLESVPEFLELFLACELIGCSVKNFIEPVVVAIELIESCSASVYITHDYISKNDVQEIYDKTHISNVILVPPLFSATDKGKIRENIQTAIDERYIEKSFDSRNIMWDVFLEKGSSTNIESPKKDDNILFSAFTSGTSGKPKEVMHSTKTIMGEINQLTLFPSHDKGKDTWLLTIAPPSLVAVVVALMFYPLIDGKILILDPFCKLEDLDLEMMHYEPTCWGMSPLFFNPILESNRIPEDYDMSYFKLFGFGSEPLAIKFIERVQAFLDKHNCKAPFSSGYGQSEGGSGFTVCMGIEMIASGSAGMPYIDTVISIFEPGTTNELTYGQIGEVCKSGPGIMVGYSDPEKTKEVLKQHEDGQLWLHTGDTGYMSPDGLLFVLGRTGIKIYPDKTIYPIGIENKVMTYPGIKEPIVIAGVDKEHSGYETPYLFVIPERNQDKVALQNGLKKHLESILAPEEQPREIFIIDEKPVSHFKTDRRALQTTYGLI